MAIAEFSDAIRVSSGAVVSSALMGGICFHAHSHGHWEGSAPRGLLARGALRSLSHELPHHSMVAGCVRASN